jgi:hypothetical protein
LKLWDFTCDGPKFQCHLSSYQFRFSYKTTRPPVCAHHSAPHVRDRRCPRGCRQRVSIYSQAHPNVSPCRSGLESTRRVRRRLLDLTQVEGLRDLVDGDMESQWRAELCAASSPGARHARLKDRTHVAYFDLAGFTGRGTKRVCCVRTSAAALRLSRTSSILKRTRRSSRVCSTARMGTRVLLYVQQISTYPITKIYPSLAYADRD